MLRLTTFGGAGLQVEGEGEPGGVGEPALPRRALALLVMLAAAPEPGVSRDTLVASLWPESDEERARSALRQTLHTLRRELRLPELVTGGVTLRLNAALVTSDLREFEIARAAGDLGRAVACYGGPFLDGFHVGGAPEFERWVESRRAEYARKVASALEALARQAGQRGDWEAASEWWRRLAALDPLNTRIAMELMAALVAAGNAGGALRHAQAHEAVVRQELAAAPDPALAALAARIRSGTSIPQRPAASEAAVALPAGPGPAPLAPAERFRQRLEREMADRYVLEGEAETSGDGSVRLVRARDRRHDRPVTLKVIHPALASQIDVERFIREIRLTGKLLHPHILPLLDSGEVAGRPWYAMPRPEGESLRERLSREGRVPVEEALRLTRELADGLGHAHAHGIVHRDVTPENVLLAGGHALLTNLGVARALDSAAGASLTDTGMLVGTPAYMSPEQAEGQGTVGVRSDVYSLAAVLFEMLTGEPLFSGPTPQAIMAKRAAEATPSAARLAGVSTALVLVIRKALARSPGDRYPSAPAFGAALNESLHRPPGGSWRWLSWLGLGPG
jgi:DNA-binding SARP family transcriptional activator